MRFLGMILLGLTVAACNAPSGNGETGGNGTGGNGTGGGSGAGGGDSGGGGGGDSGGGGGGGGGPIPAGPLDLCKGLVTDKNAHPMTALAKPAVGATVTDAEFGTKFRRVTDVGVQSAADRSAIVPLYSTVAAWNADESLLMLWSVAAGQHQLYDGKTYKLVRALSDVSSADIEQVYWDTADPDIFYYVENKSFIRYHVAAAMKEPLTTFSFCSSNASGGGDPMFMSFDSKRIGLKCGDQVFLYDVPSKAVMGRKTLTENPAQAAPSGTLAYLSDSGRVTDMMLNDVRTLDLKEPFGHASMGRLPSGVDTWNGQVFDNGPKGNSDIGSLVTFDLTTGNSRVIIGPKTGYPYPTDGHISALAYKQPGWMFVSTFGDTSGKGLLDLETLVADTSTGAVCRVGRHRAWGKANPTLGYWAEAHTVPSPSGTRAVFASDWGGGATVDTYVLELPSYTP